MLTGLWARIQSTAVEGDTTPRLEAIPNPNRIMQKQPKKIIFLILNEIETRFALHRGPPVDRATNNSLPGTGAQREQCKAAQIEDHKYFYMRGYREKHHACQIYAESNLNTSDNAKKGSPKPELKAHLHYRQIWVRTRQKTLTHPTRGRNDLSNVQKRLAPRTVTIIARPMNDKFSLLP